MVMGASLDRVLRKSLQLGDIVTRTFLVRSRREEDRMWHRVGSGDTGPRRRERPQQRPQSNTKLGHGTKS